MEKPNTFDELGTEIVNMLQDLTESVNHGVIAALVTLRDVVDQLRKEPPDIDKAMSKITRAIGLLKGVDSRM